MANLVRLPADYKISDNQEEPQERDQFLSLRKLPSLSRKELESFRPISQATCSLKMPPELIRDFTDLRASMFASLRQNEDLVRAFVSWAVDRELIDLPHHIRNTDLADEIGGTIILEKLAGNNSTWFQKAFHRNLTELEGSQEIMEQRFAKLKNQFVKKLLPLISGGILPITEERVWKKLNTVEIEVQDFFRSPYHCISFAGELRKVLVQSIDLDANGPADFFHEFFHAIAGTSVIAIVENNNKDAFLQRGGLGFFDLYNQETAGNRRFDWLNEAVTEYLTRLLLPVATEQISSEPKTVAYQAEIALLELLTEKWGISQKAIFNAYFQDHDLSKPLGQRYPAWRQLVDEFNFSFDRMFLTKLDQFIWNTEDGVSRALEILSGDDFSEISKVA